MRVVVTAAWQNNGTIDHNYAANRGMQMPRFPDAKPRPKKTQSAAVIERSPITAAPARKTT
jgi:hypothetical protein